MKRILNSCLLILLLGLTVSAQEVNDASIVGVLTEGKTVQSSYTAKNLNNPTFGFLWMRIVDAVPDQDTIDLATTEDYTIVSADIGHRLLLRVDLVDLAVYDTAWSAVSAIVIANSAPVASNAVISGGLNVGDIISATYNYYDADNDLEGTSNYQWRISTTTSFGDAVDIPSANSQTYEIQSSDEDKYFFFGVQPIAATGTTDGIFAWSSAHGPVVANVAPVASNETISGGNFVDDVLIGDYDYSDADGDFEGASEFSWLVGLTTSVGDASVVFGETEAAYKVRSSDQGKYIFFSVKPIAQTGVADGVQIWTSAHGTINSAPVASAVLIDNMTPEVGDDLTASYSYSDVDGDVEETSIYRWYRDAEIISGADALVYTVTFDDIGSVLTFEVIPVTTTGYPLEGDPAASAATASVPAPGVPVASDVCISGTRLTSEVLTGNYTYTYGKKEGTSIYKWYRDGVEVGTAINYTLTLADEGAQIKFGITPVSSNKTPVVGVEALSDSLVTFDILTDNVSVVDDPFTLIAGPPGGVFSGTGVTVDQFDPSSVNPDDSPFYLDYLLILSFSGHTCVQEVTDTVIVKPIETYFESLKSVYCYDNGEDTIIVRNLPVDAFEPTFFLTNPLAQTGLLNDTTIIIDPAIFGPGNSADSIYFSYKRDSSIIVIDKGFVIDSVGTNPVFQNLETQYCTDAAARFITVDSIYPAGGTATWTGDMLTDKSATSAVLNPTMVAADSTYPITFQYRSPHGCYSKILTEFVTINELPEPGFSIDPTYNLEGDPALLIPVTPGGTFTGPGIAESDFYPDLAGVGSHEIRYSITDSNGCYETTTNNTLVRQAEGIIESLPGVICYNDTTYSIIATGLPAGVTIAGFTNTKGGITHTAPTGADYYIPDVGAEYDTVWFEYVWDGVDYTISKTVYIDSIGIVIINNLNTLSEFCNNQSPFELFTNREGGIFTGPVSGNLLVPSSGLGPQDVSYTYLNILTGCSVSVTVPIIIHPAPSVSFLLEDVCIDDSSDTTKFINTSVSDDVIATWSWKFGDPGSSYNESNEENPGHLYLTYGPRIVELTTETINGCVDDLIQTIDLGVRPKADFSWQGDCYLPDDSLHIFSTTTSSTPVSGYSWNFFDGKPPLSGDAVKYPKLAVGTFDAELVVFTNYDGCYDTITKEIFIRPTVVLQSDSYFEDFETGTNGWVPSRDELVNLWSFGLPDRDVINSASSGVNAWYTNFDINNQESGGYSIEGPCFDFTSIERPMIQLDIWKRFDKNRDGASLQYKLGDTNEWKLLGTLENGIDWYNSFQINSAPGGNTVGWTSIAEQDTGWMTSRNRLDILKGRQDVKLRLIYASDGTSNSNDGFAFDNIWIGSRSRKVLLEHFTSYFDLDDKDANELLNDVVFSSPEDIANIQYHTKFNGADEFYYDNEADISARILYYGLSQTPYSLVGGGTGNKFAYYYDYTGTDNQIDSIDIYKRSMVNPGFRIDISSSVAGEVLTISGTVTALTDLEAENLTLYIAVVEKEVANVSGPNGEELFYNVFKKMIPNSGGIDLKKSWSADDVVDIGEQTWIIENIYDAGDIEIIFFLQNNATREVYQTATTLELDIVTGLFDRIPLKEYNNFMVYPNPASDYITLNFKEEISENGRLDIHNYAGYVVKSVEIPGDVTSVEITDLELPNGLYVLRLYTNGRPAGFRKLIIAGR